MYFRIKYKSVHSNIVFELNTPPHSTMGFLYYRVFKDLLTFVIEEQNIYRDRELAGCIFGYVALN